MKHSQQQSQEGNPIHDSTEYFPSTDPVSPPYDYPVDDLQRAVTEFPEDNTSQILPTLLGEHGIPIDDFMGFYPSTDPVSPPYDYPVDDLQRAVTEPSMDELLGVLNPVSKFETLGNDIEIGEPSSSSMGHMVNVNDHRSEWRGLLLQNGSLNFSELPKEADCWPQETVQETFIYDGTARNLKKKSKSPGGSRIKGPEKISKDDILRLRLKGVSRSEAAKELKLKNAKQVSYYNKKFGFPAWDKSGSTTGVIAASAPCASTSIMATSSSAGASNTVPFLIDSGDLFMSSASCLQEMKNKIAERLGIVNGSFSMRYLVGGDKMVVLETASDYEECLSWRKRNPMQEIQVIVTREE